MNCIFCNISEKKSPASFVYEDSDIFAIRPIDAVNDGHTLVIPRQHSENIFDISDDSLIKLTLVAKRLSKQLLGNDGVTGVNLLQASGADAQQSVFHFHLHVVPRKKDDGLDMWIRQGL